MRLPKRGKQTLTVIDPCIRKKKGLPILEVEAEMGRYGLRFGLMVGIGGAVPSGENDIGSQDDSPCPINLRQ